MVGCRAVLGLSLSSVLVLCALATPSALALQGTTAYTCVSNPEPVKGSKGFDDSHCTKAVEGEGAKFLHEEIKPGVTIPLSIASGEIEEKLSHPRIKFTPAGFDFELEAEGFKSCPEEVAIENKTAAKSKQMEASGGICGEFYNAKVSGTGGTGCVVKGNAAKFVKGTKFKSVVKETAGKEEMYLEFTPENEAENLIEFTLEKCALSGLNTTIGVTGTARANVTTQLGKNDGPTVNFSTAETEKTLTIAKTWPVTFEAALTMKAEGGKNTPVTLTTTAT